MLKQSLSQELAQQPETAETDQSASNQNLK